MACRQGTGARALVIVGALCLQFPLVALAEEDIFSISLRELLNLRVTTVSRLDESAVQAPAILSVVTSEQIKSLSARNLTEVISTIPGVFVYDNYFTLSDQVSIRGSLSENHNTKAILLMNGHPVYHAHHRGFSLDAIPLNVVERIEVVRGPASVLYGTNALTGVINVITRKAEQDQVIASVDYGSFQTLRGRASVSKLFSDDHRLFLAAEVQKQGGYDLTILAEQDSALNVDGISPQSDEHVNIMGSWSTQYTQLDINVFNQQKTAKYGIAPTLLFRNIEPFDIAMHLMDFRVNYPFNEQINLHATLRYDQTAYKYKVDNYQILQGEPQAPRRVGVGDWDGNKKGVELFADYTAEDLTLVMGASYDEYYGKPVRFETGVSDPFVLMASAQTNKDSALYANGKYRAMDGLDLVAGIRYTDNDVSGDRADVSTGLVYQFSGATSAKLLYGTAHRAPNFNELFVNAPPVIQGDPAIAFESTQSWDLGFYHAQKKWALSVNLFQAQTSDEIRALPNAQQIPTYTNLPGSRSRGVEFELNHYLTEQLHWFLRGSHLFHMQSHEANGNTDVIKTLLSGGVSWRPRQSLSVNASMVYNGNWGVSKAYALLNGSVYYRPFADRDLELQLLLNNLTNEQYTYLQWQSPATDTLPGGESRSVMIGVQQRW